MSSYVLLWGDTHGQDNRPEIKQLKCQQNKQANWKRCIALEIDFSEDETF